MDKRQHGWTRGKSAKSSQVSQVKSSQPSQVKSAIESESGVGMVDGRWSMDGTARDQELVWSRLVPEDSEGDDDPR